MVGRLTSGKWKSSGISLLWSAEKLSEICTANEVISMRSLIQIDIRGWPEELPSNEGNSLIVAGLDTCIDVLSANDAVKWMEDELYPILRSFQTEFESQASLLFWLPSGRKRIQEITSEDSYFWLHWDNKTKIPIARCLWNGAEKDAKKIVYTPSKASKEVWAGLYHPRIS